MSSIRGLSDPVRGFLSTYRWEILKAAALPTAIVFTCISSQKESILDPCTNITGVVIATLVNTVVLSILHHLIQNKWFNFWEQTRSAAQNTKVPDEEIKVQDCRSTYATTLEKFETIQDAIKSSNRVLEEVEKERQIGLIEKSKIQDERTKAAARILADKERFIDEQLALFCDNIDDYKGKDEDIKKELMGPNVVVEIYTTKISEELAATTLELVKEERASVELLANIKALDAQLTTLKDTIAQETKKLAENKTNKSGQAAKLKEKKERLEALSKEKTEKNEKLSKINLLRGQRKVDLHNKNLHSIRLQLREKRFGKLKVDDVTKDAEGSDSLELKGHGDLIARQEAIGLKRTQVEEKISEEKKSLNENITSFRDLLSVRLKKELKELNDWKIELEASHDDIEKARKEALKALVTPNKKNSRFFSGSGFFSSPVVSQLNEKTDDVAKIEAYFAKLKQCLRRCFTHVEKQIGEIQRKTALSETAHLYYKRIDFPAPFPSWDNVNNDSLTLESIEKTLLEEHVSKCISLIEAKSDLVLQIHSLYQVFQTKSDISYHSNESFKIESFPEISKDLAEECQIFIDSKNSYFEKIKESKHLQHEQTLIKTMVEGRAIAISALEKRETEEQAKIIKWTEKNKPLQDSYFQLSGEIGYINEEIEAVNADILGANQDEKNIMLAINISAKNISSLLKEIEAADELIQLRGAESQDIQRLIRKIENKKTYLTRLTRDRTFVDFAEIQERYAKALEVAKTDEKELIDEESKLKGKKEAAEKARMEATQERLKLLIALKDAESKLADALKELSRRQLKPLRYKMHNMASSKCFLAKRLYEMRAPTDRLAVQNMTRDLLQTRIELALEKRKVNLAHANARDIADSMQDTKGDAITHRLKADEARYKLAILQQDIFRLNEEWRATKKGECNEKIVSLIEQAEDLTYQFFVSKLRYIESANLDTCKRKANIALLNLILAKMIMHASRHQQDKPQQGPDFFSDLSQYLRESQKKYDNNKAKNSDSGQLGSNPMDDFVEMLNKDRNKELEHSQFIADLIVMLNKDGSEGRSRNEIPSEGLFYTQLREYIQKDAFVVNIIRAKINLILELRKKPYSCDFIDDYEKYSTDRDAYRKTKYSKKIALELSESEYISEKIRRKTLEPKKVEIVKMGVVEKIFKEWKLERVTYFAPTAILFALYYFPESLNNTLPLGGILSHSAGLMICKITTVVYLCLQSSFSKVSSLEPAPKRGFAIH